LADNVLLTRVAHVSMYTYIGF